MPLHARPATTASRPRRPGGVGAILRCVLHWLIARDRAYRDSCHLRDMPDQRLRDIGLSRRDVDTAILRRYPIRPMNRSPHGGELW